MIPARLGSQRLAKESLKQLRGVSLINRAIRKCKDSTVIDEIWQNSESVVFKQIAKTEGINFHQRPEALGNNEATSELYIAEFLKSTNAIGLFKYIALHPFFQLTKFVLLLNTLEILVQTLYSGTNRDSLNAYLMINL